MNDLHANYDRLSEAQQSAVDAAFRRVFETMRERGVRLRGDDRVERAVDALAKAIIESEAAEPDEMRTIERSPTAWRSVATGRILRRITAEDYRNAGSNEGRESFDEAFLLDLDKSVDDMILGGALREICDASIRLTPQGRVTLHFAAPGSPIAVPRSYPVYVA